MQTEKQPREMEVNAGDTMRAESGGLSGDSERVAREVCGQVRGNVPKGGDRKRTFCSMVDFLCLCWCLWILPLVGIIAYALSWGIERIEAHLWLFGGVLSNSLLVVAALAGVITLLRHVVLVFRMLALILLGITDYLWPSLTGKVKNCIDKAETPKSSKVFGVVFGTSENLLEAGIPIMILWVVVLANLGGFQKHIVSAKYSAEALPVIEHLRTLTALYNFDLHRLPGLGFNSDETLAASSQLAEGLSRVQTFSGTEPAAWAADFGSVIVVTNGSHIVRELDVSAYDMMGAKSRPAHYQYRGEMREGTNYLHVVGAFGNGDGLKSGMGYAVLELVNVDAGVKAVGTWERYKPVTEDPKQIIMVNAGEAREYFGCETPGEARTKNLCWVGDAEALMSGDPARVETAVKELEQAGWEF